MPTRYERFREHLSGLDEAKRYEALRTTKGQMYLAVEAVSQQARRLRESNQAVHTSHQADAILFVYAVRTVLSLGELAVHLVSERERAVVRDALDGFGDIVGDAVNARDALAHLDEYLVGFGKQQTISSDEKFLPWFSRSGIDYTVRVGPLSIAVNAADDGAVKVATAVLLADDRE